MNSWRSIPGLSDDLVQVLEESSERLASWPSSDAARLWQGEVQRAAKLALAEDWDHEALSEHLDVSGRLLEGIQAALIAHLSDDVRKNWTERGVLCTQLDLLGLRQFNPMKCLGDREALLDRLQEYLSQPALASSSFDWLFVNGFLRLQAEELFVGIWTRSAIVGATPRYVGETARQRVEGTLWRAFAWVFGWSICAGSLVFALASGRPWLLVGAALLSLVAVFLSGVFFLSWLDDRKTLKRLGGALNDLVAIKTLAQFRIYSPTDLLERIRAFEKNHETLLLAPVGTIVARAAERDANVLSRWT